MRCLLHRSHRIFFAYILPLLPLLRLHPASVAHSFRLKSLLFVLFGLHLASFAILCAAQEHFYPSPDPSLGPADSAGPPHKMRKVDFGIDKNFDRLLTSIVDRFRVVWGCLLGVILGTFGGQVGLISIKNAS